ncbi:hypothetical protein LAZ67_15001026 [Cordylochernes scorpioides]|uniref:Uncharacterized protein n=1 Tax=Cordylochernes scorpioides TaxID=51811 RepID=A0ABY6L8H3_9ARAC|nr:hypothetical protein LAZ67_15001026 [Cordylochernes scorpioides]
MEAARVFLEMHQRDGDQLFSRIVTGDESWVHHSTPETKRQSMVWKKPEESAPKKAKVTISAGKVMAMENFKWEIFTHPPHSPELAPSDFHLYPALKWHLGGKHFANDDEVQVEVNHWLLRQDTAWYNSVKIIQLIAHQEESCLKTWSIIEFGGGVLFGFKKIMFDIFLLHQPKYSTMTKLIRITAWCWRFYYNCLLFDPIRQKGPLTTRELTKAIQVLVKSIQQVEFCTEIKLLKSNKQLPLSNKLTSLNPFLDTQGLLRVGGRLKYSYLNENQKFPLLQPKSPRQESLIKNLLTENADIPEAIDENQEDSSILETTFVIEDEESNKDIGTPKIEISEVSVIDKSEGKYSKEPVVSVEALDKKELCHDDSAHLNVVEADLNRPKEATSGIINVYTEANESSSKEKVVPVEIVDTSTKDYLQSEDVKESEDDDEKYSSSAYIEWPEILKKEVLRPEALEKAVNLEDFEKAAESRQLSKEHLEESTEQGSCIKAESKPWEDPIESDLAAAESDNPAVPERELANESENLIQDSPQSDTQRWKLIPLPFKQ